MAILRIRSKLEATIDGLTNEELGERVRWYFKEANHSGWNGVGKGEGRGMIGLMTDLWLWITHYEEVK